jgi:hypothetical protein
VNVAALRQRSGMIAAAWILGAGVIASLANVRSIGVAALVLGIAVLPPFVLLLRPRTSPRAAVTL